MVEHRAVQETRGSCEGDKLIYEKETLSAGMLSYKVKVN
jgi:hypothetical protein